MSLCDNVLVCCEADASVRSWRIHLFLKVGGFIMSEHGSEGGAKWRSFPRGESTCDLSPPQRLDLLA